MPTKQRKQPARLWFEFYKLALVNEKLQAEVKRSKDFYKPWGDITGVKFDPWFEEHKNLFVDQLSVELTEVMPTQNNQDLLYLTIPKSWSLTKILNEVKVKLEGKVGLVTYGKKHKTLSKSAFAIPAGKELKTTNMNFALVVYKDIYLQLGQPPINREFMSKVHEYYKSRPRKNKIPASMGFKGLNVNEESVLRNLRRYIKKAKLLELNVAKGVFPGVDYTD